MHLFFRRLGFVVGVIVVGNGKSQSQARSISEGAMIFLLGCAVSRHLVVELDNLLASSFEVLTPVIVFTI